MSFFPADMPRPEPNMDDREFWASCAQRKLRFQACGDCGAPRHPPTPICYNCHSVNVKWLDAPEQALVYTYNVVHYASDPAVAKSLPYVGAVIEFPKLAGVRLISNVTNVKPGDMRIGMPVILWWDDIGEGMYIPRFRPA